MHFAAEGYVTCTYACCATKEHLGPCLTTHESNATNIIPRAPDVAGSVRKGSTDALKWRDGGGGGSDPKPAAGVQQSISGPFSCGGCPAPLSRALSPRARRSAAVRHGCGCPRRSVRHAGRSLAAPGCVCVRLPPAPPSPLPDATATRVRSRGTLQTPSTSPPRAALTTMRSSALSSRSQPTTT